MPGKSPGVAPRENAKVRIGCSGWSYLSWRPAFYPERTPQKKLLAAYAERLNTVEVNYTFRTLPVASTVQNWLAQTPAAFRFACKAPQRITHIARLQNALAATQAFARALQPLAEAHRLGPVLLQLPPGFKVDAPRLADFLAQIAPLNLVTTWEFLDPSWFCDDVYRALAEHSATLCAAESDSLQPPDLPLRTDLRVYRLRRSEYTPHDMERLAAHFTRLAQAGSDVYAFFKHEEAPTGALRALDLLGRIPEELRG
jgi:uncharacterized protein YecE (DUF72 family)